MIGEKIIANAIPESTQLFMNTINRILGRSGKTWETATGAERNAAAREVSAAKQGMEDQVASGLANPSPAMQQVYAEARRRGLSSPDANLPVVRGETSPATIADNLPIPKDRAAQIATTESAASPTYGDFRVVDHLPSSGGGGPPAIIPPVGSSGGPSMNSNLPSLISGSRGRDISDYLKAIGGAGAVGAGAVASTMDGGSKPASPPASAINWQSFSPSTPLVSQDAAPIAPVSRPIQETATFPTNVPVPMRRPANTDAPAPISSRKLWDVYNESGSPADFIRASDAMKAEKALSDTSGQDQGLKRGGTVKDKKEDPIHHALSLISHLVGHRH